MPEADESSSFLLLPRDAAHDVVVLPSLPRVEQWEPPASLGAQRQPLPATTEVRVRVRVRVSRVRVRVRVRP